MMGHRLIWSLSLNKKSALRRMILAAGKAANREHPRSGL
jgi:hypothetical protein